MSENSKIEWTDSTFNPWMGCTKVSPACDHCYAENLMDNRMHSVQWGKGQPRKRTSAKNWKLPMQWNAESYYQCMACGRRGTEAELYQTDESICDCFKHMETTRRRVFCASLADIFDNEVDPQWRVDLFNLIEQTPNLDWLLLTKRIGNAKKMIADARLALVGAGHLVKDVLPNVWIGATICNQEEADRDIPKLLEVPATVRFLSIEPLLGKIDLTKVAPKFYAAKANVLTGIWNWEKGPRKAESEPIDWVIVGGESGIHARPMNPDWVLSLRDQCEAADVPFLFKQWGEYAPSKLAYDLVTEKILPNKDVFLVRYGKKEAGRVLEGKIHNEFPREIHLEKM